MESYSSDDDELILHARRRRVVEAKKEDTYMYCNDEDETILSARRRRPVKAKKEDESSRVYRQGHTRPLTLSNIDSEEDDKPLGRVRAGRSRTAVTLSQSGSQTGRVKSGIRGVGFSGWVRVVGAARVKGKGKGKTQIKKRKTLGILGLPSGFSTQDCDYDDSEDETYTPRAEEDDVPREDHSSSRFTRAGRASGTSGLVGGDARRWRKTSGVGHAMTRAKATAGVGGSSGAGAAAKRTGLLKSSLFGVGGMHGGCPVSSRLWQAVIANGLMENIIIRSYLDEPAKCALQRTCRSSGVIMSNPRVWDKLNLNAETIGSRLTHSGRRSHLSRDPLFFLARSVVMQPRFKLLTAVSLEGVNLGPMGPAPDLLVQLFKNCRVITSLNLREAYVQAVEQHHLSARQTHAEVAIFGRHHHPPTPNLYRGSDIGVRHLVIDIHSSNKGLRVLLAGCRLLKSLHIMGRTQGFNSSFFPTDHAMVKIFSEVGAPNLEVLSLFHKENIGRAGLGAVLRSCPKLKTLNLDEVRLANDSCFQVLAPDLRRLKSLSIVECPGAGLVTLHVLQSSCPELSELVMTARDEGLDLSLRENKELLHFAPGYSGLKLTLVMPMSGPPTWLEEFQKEFSKSQRAQLSSVFCKFEDNPGVNVRIQNMIAPFMKGIRS